MEWMTALVSMFAIGYAVGTLSYQAFGHQLRAWYEALPVGLLGVFVGEGLWAMYLPAGPSYLGIHVAVALIVVPALVAADVARRNGVLPMWRPASREERKPAISATPKVAAS